VQEASGEHATHNLITGVEVGRELARRRGSRRPVGPVVFQSVRGVDAAMGGGPPQDAGPLGRVVASDYCHQLRTPQVAIEVRCFELGPEMVAVFSLVDELFETDRVAAAFAEFVALVDGLADGAGWDRVPGLPESSDPGPGGGGLRLGLLPEPVVRHRERPPADDLEQAVADVFEELLEVPVLDRAADFFGLGGDSLLAVRAVIRPLQVDLNDPAQLAAFCDGCRIVVNCAGPTYRILDTVARAAFAAGADYVDIGGELVAKDALTRRDVATGRVVGVLRRGHARAFRPAAPAAGQGKAVAPPGRVRGRLGRLRSTVRGGRAADPGTEPHPPCK
jgi:hypothetical protein